MATAATGTVAGGRCPPFPLPVPWGREGAEATAICCRGSCFLLLSFRRPGIPTAWSPVCFELNDGLRDELTALSHASCVMPIHVSCVSAKIQCFRGIEFREAQNFQQWIILYTGFSSWYKKTVMPKKKVTAVWNLKDCLPSLPR